MKHLWLGAALVLGGCLLFGCSTTDSGEAARKAEAQPLYLYWGTEKAGTAEQLLCTPLHANEDISVSGTNNLDLKGVVKGSGKDFSVNLIGTADRQSEIYQGEMTLDRPVFALGGSGPRQWFVVSASADSEAVLKEVDTVIHSRGR